MSAMKNLTTDTERQEMLYLCNAISQSRDEYREEMFRLREANKILLRELQEILEWAVVERAPLREQEIKSIADAISKAGAH